MPKIPGRNKEKITFSCEPGNFKRINEGIEKGDFSNVSEAINKALASYFENLNRPSSKDDFKLWLLSKEGEDYMKGIIRQVMEE